MNLKSIAEELGISPSTVSRVVNGNKNFSVSPELREKILACANAAGYTPNPLYQAMRKKDNRQISILMSNLLHTTIGTEISAGVDCFCEYLLDHGFSFHYLCHTLEHQKTYGLPPWKVAGALAVDVRREELVAELDGSGIPYVSLNGASGPHGTSVITDDYANMMTALEHLYQLGHRKIAYLNFYRSPDQIPFELADHHYSVRMRVQAYQDFCLARNLMLLPESLDNSSDLKTTLQAAMEQKATALVAYTFHSGVQAEYYLRKWGIRVPQDVSIIAFNDPDLAEFIHPAMTCIRIPTEQMGLAAAKLMIEKYKNPLHEAGKTISFQGKLIQRESTGPCPNKIKTRNKSGG